MFNVAEIIILHHKLLQNRMRFNKIIVNSVGSITFKMYFNYKIHFTFSKSISTTFSITVTRKADKQNTYYVLESNIEIQITFTCHETIFKGILPLSVIFCFSLLCQMSKPWQTNYLIIKWLQRPQLTPENKLKFKQANEA